MFRKKYIDEPIIPLNGPVMDASTDSVDQTNRRERERGAAMIRWMRQNQVTNYSDLLSEAADRLVEDEDDGWFKSLTTPNYCYEVSAARIARSYLKELNRGSRTDGT